MVDAVVLHRAGELKEELVAFAAQPRWERAFGNLLAGHDTIIADEHQMTRLWDYFVLEHRLRNGRIIVEQFVTARTDLPESEREMLLGWRDVVEQPFEVQHRDGLALIVAGLVDELTYRVRSNMGPSVFRKMQRGSFLFTRLVPIGDEWMLSGATTVLGKRDEHAACQIAVEQSLRSPETVYRNPEKLARAWELQRQDREYFVRFFGSDLVVMPGDKAQDTLNGFWEFRHAEVMRNLARSKRHTSAAPVMELPVELVESETVAFIYDEVDGLGFYAEYGSVEAVFADPDLVRELWHRERLLGYLHDDSIEPSVIRRLADRDPGKASEAFRKALKNHGSSGIGTARRCCARPS